MLKMLKVFWVLTPPFSEMLKTGEMLNMLNILKGHTHKKMLPIGEMLKMLKVFWVLTLPPKRGGKTQKFLYVFYISPVGSIFLWVCPFKMFNMFNISPVLRT